MAFGVPARQALCYAFAQQAIRTWDFISEGAAYKLLPGEETLTDINLIELKRNVSALVYTEKFSRYREGRQTNADWEWWIADEHGWLGLRVQAKKLDPGTMAYEAFRGDRAKAIDQAEKLVEVSTAGSSRLYPVYCFYNADCPVPATPPCMTGINDPRVYGVTVAAAPQVKRLLEAGAFAYDEIADSAIPWSCLFCDTWFPPASSELTGTAKAVLDRRLFPDDPEQRGEIDDEVPEHVEIVWRTIAPLLGPGEWDPSALPDASHIMLTTNLRPRPA